MQQQYFSSTDSIIGYVFSGDNLNSTPKLPTQRTKTNLTGDQIEKKLPAHRQRNKENSRLLPQSAIDIMTAWYDRNYSNPYPTYREFEIMANQGNISINQVKQWFVNVRRRTQNQFRKTRENVNVDSKKRKISAKKEKLDDDSLVFELDDFLMKKHTSIDESLTKPKLHESTYQSPVTQYDQTTTSQYSYSNNYSTTTESAYDNHTQSIYQNYQSNYYYNYDNSTESVNSFNSTSSSPNTSANSYYSNYYQNYYSNNAYNYYNYYSTPNTSYDSYNSNQ